MQERGSKETLVWIVTWFVLLQWGMQFLPTLKNQCHFFELFFGADKTYQKIPADHRHKVLVVKSILLRVTFEDIFGKDGTLSGRKQLCWSCHIILSRSCVLCCTHRTMLRDTNYWIGWNKWYYCLPRFHMHTYYGYRRWRTRSWKLLLRFLGKLHSTTNSHTINNMIRMILKCLK